MVKDRRLLGDWRKRLLGLEEIWSNIASEKEGASRDELIKALEG